MTKYGELSAAFAMQQQANLDYWQGLQIKAAQITAGFGDYLGLESRTYEDLKGGNVNYIQLRKHGGTEEVHFTELEGGKGAIHFAVAVTLESEPGVFPKSVFSIPLKIGKADQVLVVWSDETEISSRIELDLIDYSALYGQMFDRLKDYLSTRPTLVA